MKLKVISLLILFLNFNATIVAQKESSPEYVFMQDVSKNIFIQKNSTVKWLNPYSNFGNLFSYYKPKNWVEFSFTNRVGDEMYTSDFEVEVDVEIQGWYQGSNINLTANETKKETLKVKFSLIDADKNIWKSYKTIEGKNDFYCIQLKVLDVRNMPLFLKNNIQIALGIKEEYVYNPLFTGIDVINGQISNNLLSVSFIKKGGMPVACDEFDFEYAFIDENSKYFQENKNAITRIWTANGLDLSGLTYSRLTIEAKTTTNEISNIPLLFKKGYIVYRIREVYYDIFGKRNTGDWEYKNNMGFLHSLSYAGQEENLNWSAEVSFAEDAKHKEVLTYYDGLQRERQKVTFNNSDNQAIVSEILYDKEGRKALTTLPSPDLKNKNIGFHKYFNVNIKNTPYTEDDFYKSTCSEMPDVMNPASGASFYYSTNNSLKNQDFHSFIPDANGFPFIVTEYTNDATDRISRQGGVGATFQLASGRETKHFYGKPKDVELQKLFGSQVGNSSYYLKNMVLDPNGQASVSYLDRNGKTIATSLAGEAFEKSIINNTNNKGNSPLTFELLEKKDFVMDIENAKIYANTSHLVSGTQTIDFKFELNTANYNDVCKQEVCVDCYYDVEVSIKSKCNPLFKEVVQNFENYVITNFMDLKEFKCDSGIKLNEVFNEKFNTGEYYVSAEISIPKPAIDRLVELYEAKGACIPSLDELIQKHKSKLEAKEGVCIKNCEECLAIYGDVDKTVKRMMDFYEDNGGTFVDNDERDRVIQEFNIYAQSAKEGCSSYCKSTTICDNYREMLSVDVAPGGQYSLIYDTANTYIFATNEIGSKELEGKRKPGWRAGDATSVVTNTILKNLGVIKEDGTAYNLSLQEDIDLLYNEWDKLELTSKLLPFHPEFCYYQFCLDNEDHQLFLEETLDNVEKYDEAVAKGLFISQISPILNSTANNLITLKDPFFKNRISLRNNVISAMNSTIVLPGIVPFSLLDLAIIQTSDKLWKFDPVLKKFDIDYNYLATCNCNGLKDMIWNNYKNLYKQKMLEVYEIVRTVNCPTVKLLKIGYCNGEFSKYKDNWFLSGLYRAYANANPYCEKSSKIPDMADFNNSLKDKIKTTNRTDIETKSKKDFVDGCAQNCESMAEGWMANLTSCQLKPGLDINDLKKDLIKLCASSCGDTEYPMGTSSLKPGTPGITIKASSKICTSFDEILKEYVALSSYNTENCSVHFIDFPKPYGVKVNFENVSTIEKLSPCVCENINRERNIWIKSNTSVPFYDFLKSRYPKDVAGLTSQSLDVMLASCNNKDTKCVFLSEAIRIPNIFACNTRVDCKTLQEAVSKFLTNFPQYNNNLDNLKGSLNAQKLFKGYLADNIGVNMTYREILEKIDACKNCNTSIDLDFDLNSCSYFIKAYLDFEKERKDNGYKFSYSTHTDRYYQFIDYLKNKYNFNITYSALITKMEQCDLMVKPTCSALFGLINSYATNVNSLSKHASFVALIQNNGDFDYRLNLTFEEIENMYSLCDPRYTPLNPSVPITCKEVLFYRRQYEELNGTVLNLATNAQDIEKLRNYIILNTNYTKLALLSNFPALVNSCANFTFNCSNNNLDDWGFTTSRDVYCRVDHNSEQILNLNKNFCGICILSCANQKDIISEYILNVNPALNSRTLSTNSLSAIYNRWMLNFPSCNTYSFDEFLAVYKQCNCIFDAQVVRSYISKLQMSSTDPAFKNLAITNLTNIKPYTSNSAGAGCRVYGTCNSSFDNLNCGNAELLSAIDKYNNLSTDLKYSKPFCPNFVPNMWSNYNAQYGNTPYHLMNATQKTNLYNIFFSLVQSWNTGKPVSSQIMATFDDFDFLMNTEYYCNNLNNNSVIKTQKTCCELFKEYLTGNTSLYNGKYHLQGKLDCYGSPYHRYFNKVLTKEQYKNMIYTTLYDLNQYVIESNLTLDCPLDSTAVDNLMKNCFGFEFQIIPNPWEDDKYKIVIDKFGPNACNIIFSRPYSPIIYVTNNDCISRFEQLAIKNATTEWHLIRQQVVSDFRYNYSKYCLSTAEPKLSASGVTNEFQYTLYMYGPDGNLLQTIPPSGVNPFVNGQSGNFPNHKLITEYKYNSLNQVYEQNTPDAGTTKFIYDQLGRLILSQNAEQAKVVNGLKKYSYTLYDNLGRIFESGELEASSSIINFIDNVFSSNTYLHYDQYINNVITTSKSNTSCKFRYVVRTYYDKVKFADAQSSFEKGVQQNLKKRIASISLDVEDIDKSETSFNHALHYNYDVIGNVKELVSDNKTNPYLAQRFKNIKYNYDLVSGKVNHVVYQKGKIDQFVYRYKYDAENRITGVETSMDGLVWTKDANYKYYLHGPLARTTLGEQAVQGVDYAYTLQGWLKSINSSTLNPLFDMGRDGEISLKSDVARDASAISLRYYEGDFSQIGKTSTKVEALLPKNMNSLNLYNGNISSQTVSIKGFAQPTLSYQYRYDQLNRLVQMDAYSPLSTLANNNLSNASLSTDYAERVSYDPNGNIVSYTRNKNGGTLMDDMKYSYYYNKYVSANKYSLTEYDPLSPPAFDPNDKLTNQLSMVKDAVPDYVYDKDFDNTRNDLKFKYDAIGNLIRDDIEQMDISWTPTGKIAKIVQNKNKLILTFEYDPMGNRISKTVTDITGKKDPKITYYTRDAQGNTLAVYDNRFFEKNNLKCEYNQEQISKIENDIVAISTKCLELKDEREIASCMQSEYNVMYDKSSDACSQKLLDYVWKNYKTYNPIFTSCKIQNKETEPYFQIFNDKLNQYFSSNEIKEEDKRAEAEKLLESWKENIPKEDQDCFGAMFMNRYFYSQPCEIDCREMMEITKAVNNALENVEINNISNSDQIKEFGQKELDILLQNISFKNPECISSLFWNDFNGSCSLMKVSKNNERNQFVKMLEEFCNQYGDKGLKGMELYDVVVKYAQDATSNFYQTEEEIQCAKSRFMALYNVNNNSCDDIYTKYKEEITNKWIDEIKNEVAENKVYGYDIEVMVDKWYITNILNNDQFSENEKNCLKILLLKAYKNKYPLTPSLEEINNLNYFYSKVIDENKKDKLYWKEQHLYGSSRVGMATPEIEVTTTASTSSSPIWLYTGKRQYEVSNHLGNVLTTVKDEKKQIDDNKDGKIDYFDPIVLTATDYYPFGMPMPGRHFPDPKCTQVSGTYLGYKNKDLFDEEENTWSPIGMGNTLSLDNKVLNVKNSATLLPSISKVYSLEAKSYTFKFDLLNATPPMDVLNGQYIRYEIVPGTSGTPILTGETNKSVSVKLDIPITADYTVNFYIMNASTLPSNLQFDLDNVAFDRIELNENFDDNVIKNWTSVVPSGTTAALKANNKALEITRMSGTGAITLRRALPATTAGTYTLKFNILRTPASCADGNTFTIGLKSSATATTYVATPTTVAYTSTSGNMLSVSLSYTLATAMATPVVDIIRNGTVANNCGLFSLDDVQWIRNNHILDNFATVGNFSSYTSVGRVLSNNTQALNVRMPLNSPYWSKNYTLKKNMKKMRFDLMPGNCNLTTSNLNLRYEIRNTVSPYNFIASGSATANTEINIVVPTDGIYSLTYALMSSSTGTPMPTCQMAIDNIQFDSESLNETFSTPTLTGWASHTQITSPITVVSQSVVGGRMRLQASTSNNSAVKGYYRTVKTLSGLVVGATYTLKANIFGTICITGTNINTYICNTAPVASTQSSSPLSLAYNKYTVNNTAAIPASLTFTATATTHYFVIEKEAIAPMVLGNCSQLEIDDVVLTQSNTINDNFATLGNTSGYTGTNATLSNTNNTLEINTGIVPTVSRIYNGIAGGTYTMSFDVQAGDCAPLSLTSRYIRYELVYNGNIILQGKTTSSTVLNNITLPATGTYTLQYAIVNSTNTPLSCQLAIDNIQWNRTLFKDEFATLAGWTAYAGTGSVASLTLVNGAMQYNAGIGSSSFIGARRTLPALSQNKTYTLNARLLKTTCIVNNSIIVRVRSALNGTILGSTSYTIATNTAASVPITMNFVAPSNLSTAIVEIERAASTNCANIQIDDVELTEQRTVWEDFATIGNTSGYTANAGASVVVSNTNQTLQIAPTILATSNGVRKDIALDAGVAYTFTYDVVANATLSEKNYILCELLYGKDALYSYKIMSTQSANFVYTPTSSGTYTWRFRRVHSGANAPASSYTLDNLKVSYVIPYTRTECPETDLAYRFGFNGKEDDREVDGQQDYGMRIYDSRLGRFKSVDPLFQQYPWNSVYAFAENDVIRCVDLDGQESYHYTRIKDNSGKTVGLVHTHTTDIYKINWKKTWQNIKNGNFKAVYDKNPYKEYVVWQKTSTYIVTRQSPKKIEYDESQTFSSYNQAIKSTDEDFKGTSQDLEWNIVNSLNAAADAQRESGGGYNAPSSSNAPKVAYNRRQHYGNTPTAADRKALGAKTGEDVDHGTPLVKHYYEGDGKGGKAGHQMSQEERVNFANDRSNMSVKPQGTNRSDGGKLSKFSKDQKKKYGL